jgi:hypothetical protein
LLRLCVVVVVVVVVCCCCVLLLLCVVSGQKSDSRQNSFGCLSHIRVTV